MGAPQDHLAQDLSRCLFDALSRDPNAKQHVRDSATGIKDLRDAKWLYPQCADRGACQSLLFKACPATEPVQVWCDTCEGTGRIEQEAQHGVIGSGGVHQCPDCDGKGFNVRHYAAAAPVTAVEPVAVVMPGWSIHWAGGAPIADILARHPEVRIGTMLYAWPGAPKEPLTEQQIWGNNDIMARNNMMMLDLVAMVRAIERAHGIGAKS